MDLQGKVVAVLEEQKFNGKNGEIIKHGFVVETSGEYPKKVAFDVIDSGEKDKWGKMKEQVVVGNDVSVSFDVSSREWQGRWFTQANAFRVMPLGAGATTQQAPQSPVPNAEPVPVSAPVQTGNAEVLPF